MLSLQPRLPLAALAGYLSSREDSTEEVDQPQQQHGRQTVCITKALCKQRGQDGLTKAARLQQADGSGSGCPGVGT